MSPGAATASAELLIAADRLQEVIGCRTFIVKDSDGAPKYATTIFKIGSGFCTCPAQVACYHIKSAHMLVEREARDV